MKPLSPRMAELLKIIVAHVTAHGLAPSRNEMRVALGLKSAGHVNRMVDGLVDMGFLTRAVRRPRGIELAQSEHHHLANCECAPCLRANYLRNLELVEAMQVAPPAALVPRLAGLKPVAAITRIYWRSGFPRSMRPNPRKSQPQNAPAQAGGR